MRFSSVITFLSIESFQQQGTALMTDQAYGLRALTERLPSTLDDSAIVTGRPSARVIAVTSGKGGVGKTMLSCNLSACLSRLGQRVAIVDADLGLANAHVVLGVAPRYHLEHVLSDQCDLMDALTPAPYGMLLLAGGSGIASLANLSDERRLRLIESLSELDELADTVIVDTGAGLSDNVIGFVLAAEEAIIVTTPEPTAMADAYATIKVVLRENPNARLRILINMARTSQKAQSAWLRLQLVTRQFLDKEIEFLGAIPADNSVLKAIRSQELLVISDPHCAASRAIDSIARILTTAPVRSMGMPGFLNRVSSFVGRMSDRLALVRPDFVRSSHVS